MWDFFLSWMRFKFRVLRFRWPKGIMDGFFNIYCCCWYHLMPLLFYFYVVVIYKKRLSKRMFCCFTASFILLVFFIVREIGTISWYTSTPLFRSLHIQILKQEYSLSLHTGNNWLKYAMKEHCSDFTCHMFHSCIQCSPGGLHIAVHRCSYTVKIVRKTFHLCSCILYSRFVSRSGHS